MNRDDEIVHDGQIVRVPLTIIDAAANFARAGLVRHSPGYAVLNDADRRQRIERLQARSARIADAWRSPTPEPKTSISQTTDASLSPRDRRISRLVNAWKNP